MEIRFVVVPRSYVIKPAARTVCLRKGDWDDMFKYETFYDVFYYDEELNRSVIGGVKIAQFKMAAGQRSPNLPSDFESLSEEFFSLGQGEDYYENIKKLGDDLRKAILAGLNDVALDSSIWEKALKEDVTETSLLRSFSRTEVEGQLRRMANGGVKLTDYHFAFTYPKRMSANELLPTLTFEVEPESYPPTNIHVLIGRNGCGKTTALNLMTKSLVAKQKAAEQSGEFSTHSGRRVRRENSPFVNLISVCFSAFDSFELKEEDLNSENNIGYSTIGLRSHFSQEPKSVEQLSKEFVESLQECNQGPRKERLLKALATLATDPIFSEAKIEEWIVHSLSFSEDMTSIRKDFKRLSSGHQIVLLTITKLVELVEEKTLVLIDEPEGHLHPPLLAAFVRALSDLMVDRNGVSIIATHSPVVAQEVPMDCVWQISRSGTNTQFERPEIETFGENVGTLTRQIFGYEVTDSGFHKMLKDVATESASFEVAEAKFDGKLGAEARSLLRILCRTQKGKE
jgi:predicted ATPase